MSFVDSIIEPIITFLPFLGTAGILGLLLWGVHNLLIGRHPELGNERLFSRQLIMLGLTLSCLVALALALPVSESSRNQVIGLIGLVVSGVLAFSSTTIFANLMAGIMLRVTKPFRTGDFVSIGEYFGRVAERGLLDTEIQIENRRLVSIPNTYLITNPVSVVRSSGTVISVTLSLGYDIHHSRVEPLLQEAVKKSGLEDPFIQILELGNFSITYKASGILTDTKIMLTAHSNLCRGILDILHNNAIEIMSPTFMNQRPITPDARIIPDPIKNKPVEASTTPEEVIFDKAEEAEKQEKEKLNMVEIIKEQEKILEDASDEEKIRIKEIVKEKREQLKAFEKLIAEKRSKGETSDEDSSDKK